MSPGYASVLFHTLVLVEQQTTRALDFSERVIVLDQGAIVFEGRSANVKANPSFLDRHIGMAVA
jgi:branched-chain amino acid transport system ATP-binding protein